MENIIENYNGRWWQEIYKRLYAGVVFVEDCCAECLHWQGGLRNLIEAGIVGVKNLSSFEVGKKNQKKGIFICPGSDTNIYTIKEIIKNSHFLNVILIFTADSNILLSESNISFSNLEKDIANLIPNKSCVVEVMTVPIFAVSITDNVFVTPMYNTLYPKFGNQLSVPNTATLDLHSLELNEKNSVRRLAVAFNSLLEYLNCKEDIFYMGAFSAILAGVLEHLPDAALRRKNSNRQMSVIFVDRTIDLAGVTTHNSNSLLDKMMNTLSRFPGHSTDLAVNISNLCESDMVSVTDDVHLSRGCIVHPNNPNCKQIFDHLINKSQTEVMFSLYNKLSNVTNMTPSKLPSRITAQNLEKIISVCKGNYDIINANSELLQQALGVIQTLKSPEIHQIELFACLEMQVMQSLTTSKDSTSVLSQISNLIKSWKQRDLSMDRVLALIVYIYSIAGGYVTFSEAQEKNLQDALSVALFEEYNKKASMNQGYCKKSPEEIDVYTKTLIARFNEIAKLRDSLSRYKSVIKLMDKVSPSEYRGVLLQLVNDLVDVKKAEIPDIKYKTTGLKDFLKSGLNMLMSTTSKTTQNTSKHPFDNKMVIIFVIGGISVDECFKMHRTVMMSGSDVNLIIGSTRFVNPVEAMKQALDIN